MDTENPRIKTNVIGFDKELEEGIPQGNVVLISGTPGTMKSSLAFHILYTNAINEGVNGLYITMEQDGENLTRQMRRLGMDVEKTEGKLQIADLSLEREGSRFQLIEDVEISWHERLQRVVETIRKSDCKLIAFDSLSALYAMASTENPRNDIYKFFSMLKRMDQTSFLISEMSPDRSSFSEFGIEDFLADGIIHVKMEQIDDVNIQRRIRCVKMRGCNHSPHYYILLFSEGEFQVTRVLTEK